MRIRTPLVLAAALAVVLTGCTPGGSEPSASNSPSGSAATSSSDPSDVVATGEASTQTSAPTAPAQLPSGFPQGLFPVMDGATLVDATVSPADSAAGTVTVSMVLTSGANPPDTLAYYDKVITDQGFTVTTQNNGANTFSRDYLRADGKESVNLSINWPSDIVTVTLGANLLPGSVK
ncbi:hypothetical protein [Haematomicrobium sanguinis]|uniref:hypothetical protein n=1 Tax=Haematomicrobium sanguinis TaxID=479106 RepID=UPI00047B17B5|nr:hypothetical protein [Haematomicrobium sanguinis]